MVRAARRRWVGGWVGGRKAYLFRATLARVDERADGKGGPQALLDIEVGGRFIEHVDVCCLLCGEVGGWVGGWMDGRTVMCPSNP